MIPMAIMAAIVPMLMPCRFYGIYRRIYRLIAGCNNPVGGTICRRSCHSLKSVKS